MKNGSKKFAGVLDDASPTVPEMMELKEVASYLRIGERTVYELVKQKKIPCSRVTGKWLFPKRLIDLWIDKNTQTAGLANAAGGNRVAARVVAGSHDPLLEWAMRESGCEMAMLSGGSRNGLERLANAEVTIAGIHLFDERTDNFNLAALAEMPAGEWVAITMTERRQGLVLARGNPLGITSITDLVNRDAKVVLRQRGSGSRELWDALLARTSLKKGSCRLLDAVALTETDLALAVRDGFADAGLAIETAARSLGLDFIPLMTERFDLVMSRREYFSADVQRLLACIMSDRFAKHAASLAGYDVTRRGEVAFNAP